MSSTSSSSKPSGEDPSSVSRRDFLRVGSLSMVGLSMSERSAAEKTAASPRRCIFVLMTGGASQLETFDPKPDAPSSVRGPVKAIATSLPGVFFSEGLPRLAERAHRLCIIRSVHSTAAPIHETGYQLLHTGHLSVRGVHWPSFGSIISRQGGAFNGRPAYVVLPRLLNNTGVNLYRGQTAGFLGASFDPYVPVPCEGKKEPDAHDPVCDFAETPPAVRKRYGETRIGRFCLQARQLVEEGVRCVVVNSFDTLHNELTWDTHGKHTAVPGTVYDYRDTLCPQFDAAVSALLDELQERGLLDETLVVAAGEFGRTPQINRFGGRDHWPGVWSVLLAGGGLPEGIILGSSDACAAEPKDRPVTPGELVATILHTLHVPPLQRIDLPPSLNGSENSEHAAMEISPPLTELTAVSA